MTGQPLGAVEDAVVQRIAAAPEVFLFLDYDGTLSRLASTPADAVPVPGVEPLLGQLVRESGVRVAIVSGRPIADVRGLLDVPGVYYVGIHGAEVRPPNGQTQLDARSGLMWSILPALKERLQQALGTRPGVLIEDKGAALACHYRGAGAADAVLVRQTAAHLVQEYQRRGAPLVLVQGHAVTEIRPRHVNKGTAVCRLLAAHGPAALAVYVGDDQTDEDAFGLLPPESITIRVGPSSVPTCARYRIEGPDEVHRFLSTIREHRRGRMPAARHGSKG